MRTHYKVYCEFYYIKTLYGIIYMYKKKKKPNRRRRLREKNFKTARQI